MSQCSGITAKGNRCTRNGNYISSQDGIFLNVCKQHVSKTLVDDWCDGIKTYSLKIDDTPPDIAIIVDLYTFFMYEYNWPSNYSMCVAKIVWPYHTSDMSKDTIDKIFIDQYIDKKFNYELKGEGECPICLDTYERTAETVCGHRFCINCIIKSLHVNIQCPMCRSHIIDISELT